MKFFNKWLTAEEEEKLKSPSRRVFCIGALSTLALAAAPDGFHRVGNLFVPDESVWRPCLRINWIGMPQGMHPSLYETIISDIQRHAAELTAVGPEHFRHIYTRDPFYKNSEEERFLLTVETDVPEPKIVRELGSHEEKLARTFKMETEFAQSDIHTIYNARPKGR